MIEMCPLCGGVEAKPVWRLQQTPLMELIEIDDRQDESMFAPLDIVLCSHCDHLYNRAYDPDSWQLTYQSRPFPCNPVHISMLEYLDSIMEWIGFDHIKGKRVADVGAGSGALSRRLSFYAEQVFSYEPNQQLTPDHLPEENIELITGPFKGVSEARKVDLAVCRQVLEHVADPLQMLSQIRGMLVEGGIFYLEVPALEYIVEHDTFYEFHNEHVQYFSREHLIALAARAGFELIKELSVKEGHDRGVLLRAVQPIERVQFDQMLEARVLKVDVSGLSSTLKQSVSAFNRLVSETDGRIALYGAMSQASAFLNAVAPSDKFMVVFDDNDDHDGLALFSPHASLPVKKPDWMESHGEPDVIIICAYIHQRAISARLAEMGFGGEVIPLVEHDSQ